MERTPILVLSARITLVVLLALTVAGCASPPVKTNPEPPGPLILSAKDSDSTQTIQTGQLLQITLDANPTTGYDWAVDGAVPAPLVESGAPRFTASSAAIGAGGTETWSFGARAAGQGKLKLKYWRSFEASTPPISTFQINVVVK